MDGEQYALEVQVPDELMPLLVDANPIRWSTLEAFMDSRGYELSYDSNKFGSWNYRFQKRD